MREHRKNKRSKIIEIVKQHIKNNLKEYFTISIIFLIGILIGIIFINKIDMTSLEQVEGYLNKFVEVLKNGYEMDYFALFKEVALSNIILAILLWLLGSTTLGMPFVYGLVGARGFCFGYSVSSSLITFGVGKGILFSFTSLFLQNCLIIPCMFALAISGLKLQKSIVKDRRKENIKLEIYRHTIFSGFLLIGLLVAAFIEAYITSNLLIQIMPLL